jgi:hypothetical protein
MNMRFTENSRLFRNRVETKKLQVGLLIWPAEISTPMTEKEQKDSKRIVLGMSQSSDVDTQSRE